MSDLRLNLGDADFAMLAELGRSLVPRLAPSWTDHNVHDPGITLLELLAWISEAQIYSLSRMRRDERQAYARLLGVFLKGPRPAVGLLWPEPPSSAPWPNGRSLEEGAKVTSDREEIPDFRTMSAVTLTTARLTGAETRSADGSAARDWTGALKKEGAIFEPFAVAASADDGLVLQFEGPLAKGATEDSALSIGVGVASAEATPEVGGGEGRGTARLQVSLTDSAGERPLRIVEDSTRVLARSGLILLRIGDGTADGRWTLTIRGPRAGFVRPPRIRRIAPNVLPVVQLKEGDAPERDPFGTGLPDQQYHLDGQGLVLTTRFQVRLSGSGGFDVWTEADLAKSSPHDKVFHLDPREQLLTFGNGVNGLIPTPGAALQVDYDLSAGVLGNVAEGHRWTVAGVGGDIWVNHEATTGGRDGLGLDDLRRLAREKVRETRPIVTPHDLESAARACCDLGVSRAHELRASDAGPRVRGTRTLVAVGPSETAAMGEVWRQELESRLLPLLPLGQRLQLLTPRYVDLGITAQLEALPRADPETVRSKALETLRTRLRTVPQRLGDTVWPLGREVTLLAVKGWLRRVPGVSQVRAAALSEGGQDVTDGVVSLGPRGLPRLRIAPSDITVERAGEGGVS